ncbi:MAG: serine kinase [Okeania sp. SIO2C2]|nr:serine kinase [Okeania sp. SIO2C2]
MQKLTKKTDIPSELLPQKEPLDFFNEVYDLYQKAETNIGGEITCFYEISGLTVRLCFAGEALISRLTTALAHLEIQAIANPDLTICIWDSTSTNTIMPPPPWQGQHLQKRGEVWGLNSDRIHTSFQWGANALSLLDYERNLGIYWVNNSELVPYWETGSPLRTILHLWLGKRGIQMVHAGAVGVPSGGVLLVGKGGSGKSTTALSCLDSELLYLSDDYSLITSEPKPTAFSIYATGKKKPDDVDRLPFLKPIISNYEKLGEEKALYFLNEHFPYKIIKHFPLKAILIPRITGKQETTLTKTSVITAISSLVPSTVKQLPGTGQEACKIMTKTAEKLPCYYLNLGTEIESIPQVIFDLIISLKNVV